MILLPLQSIKSLFIEKQGAQDASKLLVDYSRAARSTKGALLLAVMGGRLSEGTVVNYLSLKSGTMHFALSS